MSAPVLDLLDRRPAAPPAAHPGIRGREAETAVLDDAIDRAAAGRLAVVLIDGEAGIGKTRLLQDALEKARCRGLRVAAAGTAELERTRPFGLVSRDVRLHQVGAGSAPGRDRGVAGPRGPGPSRARRSP